MEIAMLIIGLLLGGCVSFCILGCMQINRINDYEDEIRRLHAKERAKTESILWISYKPCNKKEGDTSWELVH